MTLLLKLVLAPLLVVGSSLAGRRWGPGLTGLLVALPLVAGPILLITYLEHGRTFVARAASASLLGLVSLAAFAVVFARVARVRSWTGTVLLGWLVCLSLDLALSYVPVPAWVALGLALAAAWAGSRLLPVLGDFGPVAGDFGPARGVVEPVLGEGEPVPGEIGSVPPEGRLVPREVGPVPGEGRSLPGGAGPVTLPWWDLPARAVVTAGLVLAVTAAAGRLGPGLTGVLAPFPTALSVVAVFTLAQGGPRAAAATMRGVLRGLGGFAAFCFLVAVLAEPIGGWAFAVAACGALVGQFAYSCRSFGK
ncbi:hypothetical protein AB0C38_09075 [Amycolatopsis sp. NPDC048633]|uniref:hypothetical protein n=1 Tax=Amycolatopsis sp. NPDC048633 TaxID=3157095 RepID=UPI0033C5F71B